MAYLTPSPKMQFFTANGIPLVGGKLYTYEAGTTTPLATYADQTGSSANPNPVIMDSRGEANVWLGNSVLYDFALKDSADVLVWTGTSVGNAGSNPLAATFKVQNFSGTGAQTVFMLDAEPPDENNTQVYVNGLYRQKNTYTVGGVILTFDSAPAAGTNNIEVMTIAALAFGHIDASLVDYIPAGVGAVPTDVQTKLREHVSFSERGGDPTNTAAANVTALALAKTYCEANNLLLDFDGTTYPMTGVFELPSTGISGVAVFSGGTAKWLQTKHTKIVGELVCDALILDSVWHMQANKIKCNGNVTLQSSNATWGTFWNNIENLYCAGTLFIDVDQGQSVNQNVFGVVVAAGGLHIKGVAVAGIRAAYNNIFKSIDTTNANLTAVDGSTGWHVLNDSVLNQTNSIHSWDAEVSGKMGIYGNWNVLNALTDANATPIAITDRNHSLFSVGKVQRNDGDFFAGGVNNLAVGGEWDVLDSTLRKPYCVTAYGTIATSTPYGATACPSQINKEYAFETSSTFSGFRIFVNCPSQQIVTLCMWYQGGDPAAVETDGGASTGFTSYTHSSGWKLARVVLPSMTNYVTIFLNGASASYKRFSINSIFATAGKTVMLPTKKDGFTKARGTLSLTGGGTTLIPLPTGGYTSYAHGVCNIKVDAPAITPNFIGVAGALTFDFAKTCFNSVDKATVIGTISKAIGQVSAGGAADVTVTGTTSGIQLGLTAGTDPATVTYELTLFDFT